MLRMRSILSFRSSSTRSTGGDRRIIPQEEEVTGGSRSPEGEEEDRWSGLLPELLGEIIKRVESSEDRWPIRKNVVSCACVCRRWRHVTTSIVGSPTETGQITFPSSLKQPGPKELPIQCLIKRDKKNSTFYLYLSLTQTFMDKGKFLLAARRFRRGSHTEFIISLDADDLSQGSTAYVGKLRAHFLGTKFAIYDSQPPYDGARTSSCCASRRFTSKQISPQVPASSFEIGQVRTSSCRASRRFTSKQISPQVPASSFEIGQVSYKFNLLKSRGPRRMLCTMQCPPLEGEEQLKKVSTVDGVGLSDASVVLENKAPRWHEHLQCWCLNFHGRVTIASVKNFQLVVAAEPDEAGGVKDDKTVILQFGKVADDTFTMDYRQPLSAFQAFAICLTSFGTKFACE